MEFRRFWCYQLNLSFSCQGKLTRLHWKRLFDSFIHLQILVEVSGDILACFHITHSIWWCDLLCNPVSYNYAVTVWKHFKILTGHITGSVSTHSLTSSHQWSSDYQWQSEFHRGKKKSHLPFELLWCTPRDSLYSKYLDSDTLFDVLITLDMKWQ